MPTLIDPFFCRSAITLRGPCDPRMLSVQSPSFLKTESIFRGDFSAGSIRVGQPGGAYWSGVLQRRDDLGQHSQDVRAKPKNPDNLDKRTSACRIVHSRRT